MEKIEYGRNVLHIRGSLYMKIKKLIFNILNSFKNTHLNIL